MTSLDDIVKSIALFANHLKAIADKQYFIKIQLQ